MRRPSETAGLRRRDLGLAGLAAMIVPSPAVATWRPTRPVTIVVPYPAGGGVDVLARLVAREIGTSLQGSFVVENVPGASGAVGSRRVARAEADGYTLLVTTNQTHATNLSLLKDGGGYDPIRDFTVIGGLADLQHLLVVRSDLGVSSAKELVERARAASGGLTCGSTGVGSASHLTMELFKARTGIAMTHVPYRGAAPLLQDMVGGRIDLAFATVPTVLGQVQAGALKALAVASPSSCPQLPGIPILSREGIDGVEADAWIAAFAPARLPSEIVESYASAMRRVVHSPDAIAAIRAQGTLPNWREPDAFAAFQRRDIERWAAVIRAAGVAPE